MGAKFRVTPALLLIALIVFYFIMLLRADWALFSGLLRGKGKLIEDIKVSTLMRDGLKREISLLDDLQYVELLARRKLGLIRRGETAYKVVSGDQ